MFRTSSILFALVSALFLTLVILVALIITAACRRASPTQPTPSPGEPPAPTVPVPSPGDPQAGFKGHYALTLQIGASCAIPEGERTRTYDAWIDRSTNREYGGYVTLGGASFEAVRFAPPSQEMGLGMAAINSSRRKTSIGWDSGSTITTTKRTAGTSSSARLRAACSLYSSAPRVA